MSLADLQKIADAWQALQQRVTALEAELAAKRQELQDYKTLVQSMKSSCVKPVSSLTTIEPTKPQPPNLKPRLPTKTPTKTRATKRKKSQKNLFIVSQPSADDALARYAFETIAKSLQESPGEFVTEDDIIDKGGWNALTSTPMLSREFLHEFVLNPDYQDPTQPHFTIKPIFRECRKVWLFSR